jgi:hypothetical protein
MQLLVVSPSGILLLISSHATFSPKSAQRTLPAWMPKKLPTLLLKMESYDGDALTRFAMRLMAYTFVRHV